MKFLMSTLIASSLIVTSGIQIHAMEKELLWTPETIINTKLISDVQISPNHESVLFVVTEPKMTEEKGVLLSRIYKTNPHSKEDAALFSAAQVSSMQPRWSPDGKWIAFLSTREGVKNLYLISSDGGESIALTEGKKDIQTYSWSPDGKKIAFVMSDEIKRKHQSSLYPNDLKNRFLAAQKARDLTIVKGHHISNMSPFTIDKSRRLFREPKTDFSDRLGIAYIYKQNSLVNRLWVIDVFSSNPLPKALTTDDYCVRGCGDFGTANVEFDWSSDSKKIVFAFSPGLDLNYFHIDSSLATVDIATGHIVPIKKEALYEALPRYSPNGHWIAYVSSNSSQRYSIDRQMAICSLDGKERRLLAPTFNEGAFLSGPNFLGWTKEGHDLLFFEPKGTKFHLVLVPIDGKPAKDMDTGGVFFKEPYLSYDKSMLGCVIQTPGTPPEAYIAKLDDFTPIQVSSVNQSLLAYPKLETEIVSWNSQDGLKIEGLLTYPVNYEEGKQYPLLLVIHGGPMGFFDETFLGTPNPYPLAAFAQKGFMILRPNPRGSCGYGKSFRHANYNDWGGSDFVDLMTGVDALIAKGIVDSERLGVMGWSYGGYMTAWTITQTSRFKAASMGAGLCNLVSMNGTTDLIRFLTDYLGNFTDQRELYEERSPIYHAFNVQTPCLIQHGTDDKRVPVSQAYEFYHALERLGKETTLVLYPGMEHRLFDPKMQLDAMERNLNWFEQYLMK